MRGIARVGKTVGMSGDGLVFVSEAGRGPPIIAFQAPKRSTGTASRGDFEVTRGVCDREVDATRDHGLSRHGRALPAFGSLGLP
jgi:hypothetical protein